MPIYNARTPYGRPDNESRSQLLAENQAAVRAAIEKAQMVAAERRFASAQEQERQLATDQWGAMRDIEGEKTRREWGLQGGEYEGRERLAVGERAHEKDRWGMEDTRARAAEEERTRRELGLQAGQFAGERGAFDQQIEIAKMQREWQQEDTAAAKRQQQLLDFLAEKKAGARWDPASGGYIEDPAAETARRELQQIEQFRRQIAMMAEYGALPSSVRKQLTGRLGAMGLEYLEGMGGGQESEEAKAQRAISFGALQGRLFTTPQDWAAFDQVIQRFLQTVPKGEEEEAIQALFTNPESPIYAVVGGANPEIQARLPEAMQARALTLARGDTVAPGTWRMGDSRLKSAWRAVSDLSWLERAETAYDYWIKGKR